MFENFLIPLAGGMLIGSAATLMLLFYGRIFGVSGIVKGLLTSGSGDYSWRIAIVLGFFAGGALLLFVAPTVFENTAMRTPLVTIAAGLLVGYGTSIGSGCTSGHGVCGLSRFSVRSLIAVLAFIGAGIITVAVSKAMGA